MREFEPKLKKKVFTREFFSKYIYILVIGLCLLLGVSYGLTFFRQNKRIATASIVTGNLAVNFSERGINVSGLSKPASDARGMLLYDKDLTMVNSSSIDGVVKIAVTRTSGLNLTDMRYALIVNGAIQTIGDMPSNGEILTTAIMAGETINMEVRLWPKTSYEGNATTFVGELTPTVRYFGSKATNISSPAGKYVNFNCSGNNCEVWQIVKVQDNRLVLTRQVDYNGATERAWTGKYYSGLTFNDDSMISSVSDDNEHKNVYLSRTVKIESGMGTQADPYVLTNNIYSEPDKKSVATITYKDGTTTLGTQKIYYDETNYISKTLSNLAFINWSDGNDTYQLGDTVTFTSNTNLTATIKATMSLSATSGTVSIGSTTTATITTDSDGTLSCLSSDDTKATCSIAGTTLTITGVDQGTADITVSQAAGTTRLAADNVIYSVSVELPPATQYLLDNVDTLETTPYGKVYSGATVNNYVIFNNEQWRILGVYTDAKSGEENLKIVRATISSQTYNYSGNVWDGNTIQSDYLYENYETIISDTTSRAMIEESAIWNVGGVTTTSANASSAYTTASETTWTGKIGLISAYEYMYAAENDGTCWTTSGFNYNSGCQNKDWLFNTITNSGNSQAWTISPGAGGWGDNSPNRVNAYGQICQGSSNDVLVVSPVVYLNHNVKITGGTGESGGNEYTLSYTAS